MDIQEISKEVATLRAYLESQSKQATGYVYFFRAAQGGPIKIGYSTTPRARRKELQTGHGDVIVCVGYLRGTKQSEAMLHHAFAAQRVRGEWFAPAPMLTNLIGAITVTDDPGMQRARKIVKVQISTVLGELPRNPQTVKPNMGIRLEPPTPIPCPRCGEMIPLGHYWQRIGKTEGFGGVWLIRHRKESGNWCGLYAGTAELLALIAEYQPDWWETAAQLMGLQSKEGGMRAN